MKNIVKKFMSKFYRNKWFLVKTLVLLMMLWFVASLEYKTIAMIMLTFVWRKNIARWCILSRKKWGRVVARHSWKVLMAVLVVQLWISLPRYRTGSDDRLQLYYLNEQGERVSMPVGHWLFNALVPEEEIMNLGVWAARLDGGIAKSFGIGGSLMKQFRDDDAQGKTNNFYAPYRDLDIKGLSLVSGTTSQAFNDLGIGSKTKSVYVLRPNNYNKEKAYPVVFFCHGYLGNWKLYQGLFAGMDDCFVVSCGTEGLSGIFSYNDISGLLNNIIPMLEREGYKIDHEAVHLIGLSNGGTACEVAQSSFPNRFKSITYISTGITHTGKTRSTINLIGGGKDTSSSSMYPAYRTLKKNGTNANILWYDDESHFVFVNKVSEIMSFILHDVDVERSDAPLSLLSSIKYALIFTSVANLLLFLLPVIILYLLLCFVVCTIILLLIKRSRKWLFKVLWKGIVAWRRYMERFGLPILLLWVITIFTCECYQSIIYDWTQWDGFMFHDEKDIGKCLDIDRFPMCHVINKNYRESDDGGTSETVTFDTDDYAHFIKKLSGKVDKDSLWDSYYEGNIRYQPDSTHTPKDHDWIQFNFEEGDRRFTIDYSK